MKNKAEVIERDGFILINSLDEDIVIELVYATSNNFTNRVIYLENVCVLRSETAKKLVKANEYLKKQGFKLKVLDGYRPLYAQKIFWDICPNNDFVANPDTGGSIHNRGCAVDVTLVDSSGREVIMPSNFDDFTIEASRSNSNMSYEARTNLEILTKAMILSGFNLLEEEWWHFTDADAKDYEIVDIDLNIFLDK